MTSAHRIGRRELLGASVLAVAASPVLPLTSWAASTSVTGARVDPMSLVDPELRGPLEQLLKTEGNSAVDASNLTRFRRLSDNPTLAAPRYEERMIPGPKGAPDVHIYVVNAAAGGPARPGILHIHGGGFIAGAASEYVCKSQQIALEHDCVVVVVDYRLAPETHFPGSLEDNYAALKWMHGSAKTLGLDPSRIAVMGSSAGGGHAAILAIAARDRGEVPIAFQLLIYPMLDDRTGSTRNVAPHIGAYAWLPESNRFGWTSFLGVPAGSSVVPNGAVPARVTNLAGLPPAFIGVGSIDLFVDEDIDYARRLIDAGVPTELSVVPGCYHGFDIFAPEATVSKAFRATWSAALARAIGREPS